LIRNGEKECLGKNNPTFAKYRIEMHRNLFKSISFGPFPRGRARMVPVAVAVAVALARDRSIASCSRPCQSPTQSPGRERVPSVDGYIPRQVGTRHSRSCLLADQIIHHITVREGKLKFDISFRLAWIRVALGLGTRCLTRQMDGPYITKTAASEAHGAVCNALSNR
jgi:hypothetical protein